LKPAHWRINCDPPGFWVALGVTAGRLAGSACLVLAEKQNKTDLLRYYQKWKSS